MRETRWYKVINIAQLDSYPMLFSLKTKFCEFTSEYNRGHKWGSWKRHLFLWKSLAWVSDPECRRHVFMIGKFVSADQKKVWLIYFNEHCPNFVTFWDHVRRKKLLNSLKILLQISGVYSAEESLNILC